MASRNPSKHGHLRKTPKSYQTEHYVLCSRDFYETHKSGDESVCENNHQTYYFKHRHISGIFPSLEARDKHNEQFGLAQQQDMV